MQPDNQQQPADLEVQPQQPVPYPPDRAPADSVTENLPEPLAAVESAQPVEQPIVEPIEPSPAASPELVELSVAEPVESPQQLTEEPTPENLPQEQAGPTELPAVEPVSWQGIEYIQHDKTPIWYVGFVVIIAVLMTAAILLGSWTFAILIPVMAAALVVYSHRPPREISYVMSEKGLHINHQLHPMGEFKSFGVIQDGEHNALAFIPVKRFRPALTVYFPTEVGEGLVDFIGAYLPMQELHLDMFDRIIRKLRI